MPAVQHAKHGFSVFWGVRSQQPNGKAMATELTHEGWHIVIARLSNEQDPAH